MRNSVRRGPFGKGPIDRSNAAYGSLSRCAGLPRPSRARSLGAGRSPGSRRPAPPSRPVPGGNGRGDRQRTPQRRIAAYSCGGSRGLTLGAIRAFPFQPLRATVTWGDSSHPCRETPGAKRCRRSFSPAQRDAGEEVTVGEPNIRGVAATPPGLPASGVW